MIGSFWLDQLNCIISAMSRDYHNEVKKLDQWNEAAKLKIGKQPILEGFTLKFVMLTFELTVWLAAIIV